MKELQQYTPAEFTAMATVGTIVAIFILFIVDSAARWLAPRFDRFCDAWTAMMNRAYNKMYGTLLKDITKRGEIDKAMTKASEDDNA